MSRQHQEELGFSKVVEQRVRRMAVRVGVDSPTSERNESLAQDVITLWLCLIADCLRIRGLDFRRRVLAIIGELPTEGNCCDFVVLQDALSEIDAKLTRTEDLDCLIHEVPARISWLRGVIRDLRDSPLGPVAGWRDLHTICQYMKRTNFTELTFVQAQSEEKFFDNVERLSTLGAPTTEEAEIVEMLFGEFSKTFSMDLVAPLCRFGNGNVSGLPKGHSKVGWDKWGHASDNLRTQYFCRMLGGEPFIRDPHSAENGAVSCATPLGLLMFVPKSYNSYRVIRWEDAGISFYAQGLFRAMERYASRHTWHRSLFHLRDQSVNRLLALTGSRTGRIVTVDQSMASDCVRNEIVRSWFPKRLAKALLLLRAPAYEYNGKVYRDEIYAGMGSPLCFTVLTICMAAMGIAAARDSGVTSADALRRFLETFSAYGDDVTIRVEFYDAFLDRCKRNGFIVNEGKTFRDGWFRESCGGEYLRGADVTPLRVSRRFAGFKRNISSMAYLTQLANEAFGLGYEVVRRFVIGKLRELRDGSIPDFVDDVGLLTEGRLLGFDAASLSGFWDKSASATYLYSPCPTSCLKAPRDGHEKELGPNGWEPCPTKFAVTSRPKGKKPHHTGVLRASLHQLEQRSLSLGDELELQKRRVPEPTPDGDSREPWFGQTQSKLEVR